VTHKVAKEARIISLSPLLERGKIRFIRGHSDQELLIEQLLYFPSKTINDDGPDALEGAVWLSQSFTQSEIEYRSAQVRRFNRRGLIKKAVSDWWLSLRKNKNAIFHQPVGNIGH